MARPQKKPNPQGEYQCSLCKEWKHPIMFYSAPRHTKAGLSSWCKDCYKRDAEVRRSTAKLSGPLPREPNARHAAVRQRLEQLYEVHTEHLLAWLEVGNSLPEEFYTDYKVWAGLEEEEPEEITEELLDQMKRNFFKQMKRWPTEEEVENW